MECFKCSINLCKTFCARVISFLRVRTDRQGFGILILKHVGTQKVSTQNEELAVDRYMHPRITGMHNTPKIT